MLHAPNAPDTPGPSGAPRPARRRRIAFAVAATALTALWLVSGLTDRIGRFGPRPDRTFLYVLLILGYGLWVGLCVDRGRAKRLGRLAMLAVAAAALTLMHYAGTMRWLRGTTPWQRPDLVQWTAFTAQAATLTGIFLVLAGLDVLVAWLVRRLVRLGPPGGHGSRRLDPRRLLVGLARIGALYLVGLPWLFVFAQTHPGKFDYHDTPASAYECLDADIAGLAPCAGWPMPADEPSDTVVLICHGLGADQANFLPYSAMFHEMGCHVVSFDLPGHGRGPGLATTFGPAEAELIGRIARWVRQHPQRFPGAPPGRLVGFGGSMGGTSLLLAAQREPGLFDALIIDSAYATLEGEAEHHIGHLPSVVAWPVRHVGRWLLAWQIGQRVASVDATRDMARLDGVPKLFLHCDRDRIVPAGQGRQLYESAGPPKRWVEFDCRRHQGGQIAEPGRYRAAVAELLRSARTATSPGP